MTLRDTCHCENPSQIFKQCNACLRKKKNMLAIACAIAVAVAVAIAVDIAVAIARRSYSCTNNTCAHARNAVAIAVDIAVAIALPSKTSQ